MSQNNIGITVTPDDRIVIENDTVDVFYETDGNIKFVFKNSNRSITLSNKEAEVLNLVFKKIEFKQEQDGIENQYKKLEKITGRDDLSIGTWECKRSPIQICVYDEKEDPCLDDCIFCGEPDERK